MPGSDGALYRSVLHEHQNEPGTLVVDELGLCNGDCRVDVAVVNGEIHGYEIKSPKDTLDRLPSQAKVYSDVLDRVTLVTCGAHLENAYKIVPDWWGVTCIDADASGEARFQPIRPSQPNPVIVARSVVTLLWKEEVLAALEERGLSRGIRGKPRRFLYDRLAEALPINELRALVRVCLKKRPRSRWRADAIRT
jgi:hypothetical protein